MKSNAIRKLESIGILLLLILSASAHAGEGFGMMKKTANLTRVRPPQVFIRGTRIGVSASSQGSAHAATAQRLQSLLESELLGNNPRFKLDSANPEATVAVTILQSDYNEEWQDRTMLQSYKTGSVDSKNRPIYAQREVNVRFKIVHYVFGAAFKVHDRKADRSLIADTVNRPFKKEYQEGNGAPDAQSLENDAVLALVSDLTHRLAPTKEIVGVLLPKGSMEAAAGFADAGLWSKYLDSLEKMTPLAKSTDEAYRQYAMGVAYEALGYGADDVDTTLKYLEQASVHYNNAVDAHPKESYFTKPYQSLLFNSRSAEAPLGRVQAALVQYQKFKEFAQTTEPAGGSSQTGAKELGGGDANAMTNDAVVDMLRAGLPEDVILTAIETAHHPSFDVSPRGLIQLSEAKASKKLMQRLQAIAAGGAKPAAQKPKKSATVGSKEKQR